MRMRNTAKAVCSLLVALAFLIATVAPQQPAGAAPAAKSGPDKSAVDQGNAGGGDEVVAAAKDKPKKSKIKPKKNDDKDDDPDDGDAGGGNDDKKKKNDGPAND